VILTQFGRDMLPAARRLVRLADDLEHEAERARRNPLRFAVPDICTARDLARLTAEGRREGIHLDLHPAAPSDRAELVRSREARAALTAAATDEATWSVRLGLAAAADLPVQTVYVETLRVGRAAPSSRRRRVRGLMADNLLRHRLAPDFSSDASMWSSKTGTLLNLRHEFGVVEHADGQVFGIAVLTESRVPAVHQPGAEALMAQVARTLRDHLRQR
jgi:DNA-binding transcriptional LysR family regulator